MNRAVREKYKAVIGLEVHAQLLTETKIFASDGNSFGNDPNTNISVITLGHPGTLPKLNRKAIEHAIKMGLACHCEISRYNIFDRKNYFYPDLPKGYQITQDKTPICKGGYVTVSTNSDVYKKIRLNRIHLEEDAGKSIHLNGEKDTLVDFNRAGVPLIEIVTEPVLQSSEEAAAFLAEIRKLVKYLDICDGNMEEGSLRCDANVSIMPVGTTELGKKVEVKNMNSIKNVARAIDHEIERQIKEVERGNPIFSETRTFDADRGTTSGMRTKEELNDYRYFPEPDLSPMEVSDEWLKRLKAEMPALPGELFDQFVKKYKLPEYDAAFLTESKEMAQFFVNLCNKTSNFKAASNWMMGPVKSFLNGNSIEIGELPVSETQIAELIALVDEGKVSFSAASQRLFPHLTEHSGTALEAAQALNLIQDSDSGSIQPIIDEVLAALPEKVKEYRGGKKGLVGMFMGEVMKKSSGKVDPKLANKLLRESLEQ